MKLRPNTATDSSALMKAVSKRAEAAKADSIEVAWEKIFASKLTDGDRAKVTEVKEAMDSGAIGRHPESCVNKNGKPKAFSKAEALRLYAELKEARREQTLADMVANTPANYELITSERQLAKLIGDLGNEEVIAVDTETTGVDVYSDVIVGLSFSLPKAGRHVYIPVAHNVKDAQLKRGFVLESLAPILDNPAIGKVLHNAIFDIAMFRRHGFDLVGVIWDTMTAMHLLNENEPSFKLKDLAPKFLGVPSDTFAELFGKDARFDEIPLDIALVYAAKDTELTYKLYEFQKIHMAKMPTILEYYETVEVPLLYVIVQMEANGYILDLDFAKQYGEKLHKRADELREQLIEGLAPFHEGDEPLNLNSTQQMRPALSAAIGEKLPNMDAKRTLKPLAGKHPIVAQLLEYKKLVKMSGTYIDTLPTKQNPTTRRWHSRYNPMGTVTGRFSSGKDEEDKTGQGFNAQNIPGEARPMFIAPEGKVLVGADFKAQEIRCVAYLSGEPVLINAFLEERDPYAMMASTFYKRPYEEVYKTADGADTPERKQMKVVWLATLYGMSKYSLAEMLKVEVDAAVKFQKELFESMPKLNAWIEGNKKFVEKNGYVWTDKQARKRRLPDGKLRLKGWGDPNFGKKNRALRQSTNARVQGSSSIQTKVTMIRAHEECSKREGWQLWATVHDELIFEIPADFTREDAKVIEGLMLNSYAWGDVIPNGTDLEVMKRWGAGVTVEAWFENKEGAI